MKIKLLYMLQQIHIATKVICDSTYITFESLNSFTRPRSQRLFKSYIVALSKKKRKCYELLKRTSERHRHIDTSNN